MREGPYWVVRRDDFVAKFLVDDDDLTSVNNVDVHVTLPDGTKRVPTVLTLAAIDEVMTRHAATGEDSGSYFWAADLVISRSPGVAAITEVIAELVASGEILDACTGWSVGNGE